MQTLQSAPQARFSIQGSSLCWRWGHPVAASEPSGLSCRGKAFLVSNWRDRSTLARASTRPTRRVLTLNGIPPCIAQYGFYKLNLQTDLAHNS